MGLVIYAVVALSMLTEQCIAKGYAEPRNCKRLECPSYDVFESGKEYEIRRYRSATWVTTPPINSSSYDDASRQGFNILFKYIQGKNNQAAKIEMTAPVLVDIHPSTGPLCNSTFVMHFHVPRKFQKNIPSSAEARAVRLPIHKYAAVRRFGGFMDGTRIPTQVAALKKSLKGTFWESPLASSGSAVPYYSVAGYNSPFEVENRVNEVMLWFDKH